ncbi:MAG: hypothetical protein JNN00_15885 [Chitinophagaceae bacterium]|nr:hypothetical protein [Chitinophagaceae bacterium]
MRRVMLLLTTITILTIDLFGQADIKQATQELVKLPVPPTPEAAALGKFGDIPVGLSTGIPDISIPIHQYKDPLKKLDFSVGLSYHAGGHKVEDMPSSCGLGWALNAAGMVTRTVNGLPDDQLWGYLSTDSLPSFYTQPGENFHYVSGVSGTIGTHIAITKDEDVNGWFRVKDIQDRYKDGEADMFSFNVAGLSGTFFIKKNLQAQLLTQANVSITIDTTQTSYYVSINGFTIKDKNTGISYYCDLKELTIPSSISVSTQYGMDPYSVLPSYTSTWFLTKIKSADGLDSIKLNYINGNTLSYETGFAESKTCEIIGTQFNCSESQYSHTLIQIYSKHLRSIELPDNTIMTFLYNFTRLDFAGDSALTSIEIKNGDFKKTFNLSYDYFVSPYCSLPEAACSVYGSANDYYKRLKLLKIQQSNGTDTLPSYRFEYNPTQLPTRKSMAQDYWGYYRGGISTSLIPYVKFPLYPNTSGAIGFANREPSEEYMKAWILEKIIYPTGGYTKFQYEINKAFGDYYNINEDRDTGWLSQAHYNQYQSLAFTNRDDEDVDFTFKLYADTSSNGGPQEPWGCNFTYTIKSTDNAVNTEITATIEEFLNGYTATITLPLNKTYQIKFTSECGSLPATYYMDIFYQYKIIPLDRPIGGLRVARTEDYDGFTSQPVVNNYTYLRADGHSSGEYQNLPNYNYYYSTLNEWDRDPDGNLLFSCHPRYFINRTSTPSQALSYYRGSPVIYKRVKVDKTNNNKSNGYSVNEFSTFASTQVITNDYPFVQKQDLEWRQGLPLKDSVFTSSGQLAQTSENEYTYIETMPANGYGRNLITSMIQNDDASTQNNFVYGARAYYYMSGRSELKKTRSRTFKGSDFIESVVEYAYDQSNFLLTKQKTTNSIGDTLESRLYYPANYNSTGLPYNVAGYNGEAEVVSKEDWIKKGSTWFLRSATASDYQVFNSIVRHSKAILTETSEILNQSVVGTFNPSQLKRHASFTDQVEISKYSSDGRYTEVKPKNSFITSFIWSPFKSNPVAQVVNAAETNIAFTSFETETKGNWTYSGSETTHPSAPTGKSGYSLAAGNITKSGLSSGATYIVSYWKRDSASTVTVNSSSGTDVITKNGWKLITHEITGTTSVTVSGTAYIDELRLYPKGALMTTYTYSPLIGMTSQCDANNRVIYYNYDSFGRLKLVKDQDGMILKRVDYKYQATYQQ